jgi:hypothetical protein
MALHLLLAGTEDERLLLSYIVRPPAYLCGMRTDDAGLPVDSISIEDVLELDYSQPLSYGIIHPDLGESTSVRNAKRKLSWKSEILFHEDYLAGNRGQNVLDPYLSPMMFYRRPHTVGEVIAEGILIPIGAEAYPLVNDWYKRVSSWCRRKAKNVYSWKSVTFPGQFVSEDINTRWAFPAAFRELQAGRTFCAHGLTERGIEVARERQERWTVRL